MVSTDVPETNVLLLKEEEEGKGGDKVTPCRHYHTNSPDVDGGWAWVVFVMGFLQFFLSSGESFNSIVMMYCIVLCALPMNALPS